MLINYLIIINKWQSILIFSDIHVDVIRKRPIQMFLKL